MTSKIFYYLQGPQTTDAQLKASDLIIKATEKKAPHLRIHTPAAALYVRVKDGGLGLTELRSVTPKTTRTREIKLNSHIDDLCLIAALNSVPITGMVKRLTRIYRSLDQKDEWKAKLIQTPTLKGLEQAEQDLASTNWINYPPNGWTGKDYVKAIQLRFNAFSTIWIPSNLPDRHRCRAGCNQVESLSHVIQHCPTTRWQRIPLHNKIANKIGRHCSWQFEAANEPHVRHPDGTLYKPDLVIIKGNDIR